MPQQSASSSDDNKNDDRNDVKSDQPHLAKKRLLGIVSTGGKGNRLATKGKRLVANGKRPNQTKSSSSNNKVDGSTGSTSDRSDDAKKHALV